MMNENSLRLSAKALLDELMGQNRNAPLNSEIQAISWQQTFSSAKNRFSPKFVF